MSKKINIPNLLSILRISMIPALVLLIIYSSAGNYPLLICLFLISILLDFFDGYLARKLSQETELGKILDPLADKLLIFFTIAALLIKTDFPLWLALIVVSRDLIILLASLSMLKKIKSVTPSILVGKFTFGILGALISIYIIDLYESLNLEILKKFLIILSLVFVMWSWVEYYNVFRAFKRGEHAK